LGDIKKSIKCKLKYRLSKDNKLFDGNIITPEFDFVDRVITSGNIINLRIWKRIGEFNEQLFIDEVDHEFCYRLRNQGYNIIQIHTCRMYHSLGINKRTLFSHHCQHEGIRLYYIMRNLQFIKKQYRGYFNEFHCQQYIRRSIFEKIMFLKFSDLKYMYQGIVDARENIFGKYKY
jgi:rhamnosyltransferase